MMRATTRPRRSSGARSAAKGIMTWPATEAPPTSTEASGEDPQVGGEGAGDQGHRAQAEEAGHQAPAGVEIAQRDDQQQAGGVADLGGRDDGGGGPRAAWNASGHLVQHGLGVVEVGHHRTGGDGDEDDEAAGESVRRLVGAAAGAPSSATGSGYRRPLQRLAGAGAGDSVRRCRRAGSRR